MKLVPFDNAERQIIRINNHGMITISAAFVHENHLEGKNITLMKDEEDKDKKFLYVTYSLNGNGVHLKKNKTGSFIITNKCIAEYFSGKASSIKFLFLRRISDKNEPYFLFEKKA